MRALVVTVEVDVATVSGTTVTSGCVTLMKVLVESAEPSPN